MLEGQYVTQREAGSRTKDERSLSGQWCILRASLQKGLHSLSALVEHVPVSCMSIREREGEI
jgi:hypothetical protein